MHQLREHSSDGRVVATSTDGITFVLVLDGSLFATRSGDSFTIVSNGTPDPMAVTHGRVGGDVVYVRDADSNEDVARYWLENT